MFLFGQICNDLQNLCLILGKISDTFVIIINQLTPKAKETVRKVLIAAERRSTNESILNKKRLRVCFCKILFDPLLLQVKFIVCVFKELIIFRKCRRVK